MKNVKVFIASSAELDEDKLQMDLYFSQKNKGYRKRAICFEQRTWRDFPATFLRSICRIDTMITFANVIL